MSKRIRKQCFLLTSKDLERFPCWEFALDEEGRRRQDEAIVRPVSPKRGFVTSYGPVIVMAVFSFPNGRARFGLLTLDTDMRLGYAHPAIFVNGRQLSFYRGAFPPALSELKKEAGVLGSISDPPFPIHYSTVAHSRSGEPLFSGVLEGFYKYGGDNRPPKRIRLA